MSRPLLAVRGEGRRFPELPSPAGGGGAPRVQPRTEPRPLAAPLWDFCWYFSFFFWLLQPSHSSPYLLQDRTVNSRFGFFFFWSFRFTSLTSQHEAGTLSDAAVVLRFFGWHPRCCRQSLPLPMEELLSLLPGARGVQHWPCRDATR